MVAKQLNQKRYAYLVVGIQFSAILTLSVFDLFSVTGIVHHYLAIEITIVVLGVAIICLAAIALRPSLRISPIPKKDSPLIASGIYRYVRHPMYLGVILIGFGMSGYSKSSLAWLIELILLVDLNVKARFEDRLLVEAHPESFDYQLQTSRIIPCLGGSCRINIFG